MLLSARNGIYRIDPIDEKAGSKDLKIVSNEFDATAIDYDWQENCLYWSEITLVASYIKKSCNFSLTKVQDSEEKSFKINPKNIQVLHSNTLQSPECVAIDWIGRNLYWCDKKKPSIEVSRLDGKFRLNLIKENLEEPTAIVLNPLEGILFWTNYGEKPHIGKASMDGSNHRIILEDSLGWPSALTIDFIRRLLYFADAREDYIGTIDFYGQNRKIILDKSTRYTSHIFSMSFFENRLYWTDWRSSSVISCPVTNCTSDHLKSQITFTKPMDIKVWHPDRQPLRSQKNPCLNKLNSDSGCMALCLLRNDAGKFSSSCACPENYILDENQYTCRSNCSRSEFVCNSTYKCIPFWWKCDTQDDCGDGSDEPADCEPFHCIPDQFQCRVQSQCILPQQICDGILNCIDKTDEIDCDNHVCMANQFKCPAFNNSTAYCISAMNRCDGSNDCPNGEDEIECDCPRTAFKCANKKCISKEWECDGEDDCGDMSDEYADCSQRVCGPMHFRCDSGRCIPESWRCDNEPDCSNHQDEIGCDHNENKTFSSFCDENHFRCDNERCVDFLYRCDLDEDCGDGSDESNCTVDVCTDNKFSCDNGYKCLNEEFRCNGAYDCVDLSDEFNCQYKCDEEEEFRCSNSAMCILSQWKCDGDFDCSDGSDEINCTNKCSLKDFTCKSIQQCIYGPWRCDGNFSVSIRFRSS